MTRPRRYPARTRTLSSSSLAAPDQASNPHPRLAATARVHENCARTSGSRSRDAALTSTTVTAPSPPASSRSGT